MAELSADIIIRTKEVLEGLKKTASGIDNVESSILELQGTTIQFNRAFGEFFEVVERGGKLIGRTVDATEGLNSIGIRTTAQFRQQAQALLALRKAYANDVLVVRQLDEQLAALNAQMTHTTRQAGRSSIIWFQAGQAISDFAVAGVLGAANNIEFLAAQIGLGGPLLGAIAVATTSFIIFGDDIAEAFAPISKRVKELGQAFEDVINVIETGGDRVANFFDRDLPGAIEETEKALKDLEDLVATQRFFQTGFAFLRNPFAAITPAEEELAKTKAFLEDLKKRLEEIENRESAVERAMRDRRAQLNEAAAETIRFDLERAGLGEKIVGITDDELLKKNEILGIEGLIAELKGKGRRDELTELERAQKANDRLKERLEALRNIDNSRLGAILQQNKALEEQIKVVQRLNAERAKQGGGLGIPGLTGLISAGLRSENQPIGELIEDIKKAESQRQKQLLSPRLLNPEDVEEIENAADRYVAASLRMKEANEQLARSIEDGVSGAISMLVSSLGSGEGLFDGLRKSIGTFAIQVGETLIGFGTAGIALQTFITNPVGAIIAGSALVALGSALKSSVSKQSEDFSATGVAGAASLPPDRIDPRQGRRFRRGYEPEAPGSMTLLDKLNSIGDQFTFRIQGEDLVASADATYTRQNRTRNVGTASTRGVGR